MTAAVAYLPNIAAACDRITARDRAENIRVEAAEKLRDARAALRSPSFYSNDELRAFCVTLMNSDDPDERGMDWLRAKQMIETLNRKEFIARNCPGPEKPAQIAMRYRPQLLAVGAGLMLAGVVAVAFNVWVA